jgi:hypothetical protein
MYRPVAGFCVPGNEPSRFRKSGEFLYSLNNYWLLDKQLCCVELMMIISGYENVSVDEVAIE